MLSTVLAIAALMFLLAMFEIDPKTVQDSPGREKPPRTPPEIRRRIAEVKGENQRLWGEYSRDGRIVTDEEWVTLTDNGTMVEQLERQLVGAERWGAADAALEGRQSMGRIGDSMLPHNDTKNTRKGYHEYSLLKVYRQQARMQQVDGLEAEVHQEMQKERVAQGLPRPTRGILVPLDLPADVEASRRLAERTGMSQEVLAQVDAERRALTTVTGGGSIPTILSPNMIDILRARMVTMSLGARVMNNMQGLFAIPRQDTTSTFYMVGEGVAITPSNQTIGQVPFVPHTGGVNTTYTRQFLEQTNVGAESFVRQDQAAVVARGVETAALNGQGGAGWPLGILQNPKVDLIQLGTNGAAPTWATLVAMEAHIAYHNADVDNMAYVVDPLTRGTFKVTLKVSGSTFPVYLWEDGNTLNGYRAGVTNLLPQNVAKGSGTNLHAMIFGNWSDLIYAFWSGMDTIVDPYSSADSGSVRIVTMQDFDANIRHTESFSKCLDIAMDAAITVPTV